MNWGARQYLFVHIKNVKVGVETKKLWLFEVRERESGSMQGIQKGVCKAYMLRVGCIFSGVCRAYPKLHKA